MARQEDLGGLIDDFTLLNKIAFELALNGGKELAIRLSNYTDKYTEVGLKESEDSWVFLANALLTKCVNPKKLNQTFVEIAQNSKSYVTVRLLKMLPVGEEVIKILEKRDDLSKPAEFGFNKDGSVDYTLVTTILQANSDPRAFQASLTLLGSVKQKLVKSGENN